MTGSDRIFAALALVAVLLLLPVETAAQTLTGTLVGTVHDAAGGVLPGATIRLASSALMAGEERTSSDAKGGWRFGLLPPGKYTLTVELAPSFAAYKREDLQVGAGETLNIGVELRLAGVTESLTVESNPGITRSTGLETRFGPDYIRTVPSRRFSMFDLIRSVPGVSPSSPTSGTVNGVSMFGSGVNENAFLIDGTNFTCPCQGVSRAEPIIDVIQELHVQSMGASVEYGNIQGGVFNVVTKQGGARLASETSYFTQPSSLTSQPVQLSTGNQPASGYERERYRDLTTSLGGPLKQERVWFFGAYQYLRDYDSSAGTNPAFPRKYEQDKIFGKLTSQLTPSMQLMNSYHQEFWVNPTAPTVATPFVATQRLSATVPSMTLANFTHVLSNRTMWEARAGRFLFHQDWDPSSGDWTTPFRRDRATGISSGNAPFVGFLKLDRFTAKAVLTRYQSDWLGADHDFRVGGQFERGEHRKTQAFIGGVQYVDNNAAPFQAIFREPSLTGGVFFTSSLFASDSINVTSRVTIDAGLRFDHSRAVNPDMPALDAAGQEINATLEGSGTIYQWNVLSPRLGMNLKLDRAAATLLRASYGRFNQGVLTGELDPISQGATSIRTMAWDPSTGGYTRAVSTVDPTRNLSLDPNMRTPHTDEFSVAVDREMTPRLRASLAYVGKRGSDFIGWTDVGGQYRPDSRVLADGRVLPVFVLTNSTADRRFVLANPENFFVHYDALVFGVEKRLSGRWQASGSYTYSRTNGLQVTSNGAADAQQSSTIASPTFGIFGQDPNDLTNAAGRLPNDRPHIFRASAIVHLPWSVLVATNLQHFSGKPWAATTQVALPQGDQRIMLEPRGSRRLPSQTPLDLRVSKTLSFGQAAGLTLNLDVLNLLNDTAEEALVSDNFFNATFGKISQVMDPRRVMLGLRLNFGR
jgi:hypothetical protein